MFKLSLILESSDWWIHDYYRIKDQMNDEFGSGQKYQSWRLVPKKLLDLTWMTFVKYGRVNEKALEKIWDIIRENVIKIAINSDIRDGRDVDIFGKEAYAEVTEEEWKRFFNFISDRGKSRGYGRGGDWDVEKGHARYSDSSNSLFKLAEKAEHAGTPEEKLLAIDQILNFIHGIGYMADWFVEGGVSSLVDLRDREVKGIQLQGQLREEIPPPIREQQSVAGKTFMVVDVQPEYKQAMPHDMVHELVRFITDNYEQMGQLVFLYNGADTLGMIDETSYKMWWIENGLDENIVDQADFYDKGYAFFRYCMDSGGASEEAIANFVRFMYENDIRDSRDMDRDAWAKYLREYRRTDRKEVMDLLRHQSDCVHVPDLMDYLRRYTNLVICGGGVNECLKEVEIALQALRKPYEVEHEFTY